MIGFDFETHLINKEYPYPKPVCLSSFNGWNKKLVIDMEDMEDHLKTILDTQSVAHNATFECGVIYNWFPNLRDKLKETLKEGRIFCTQLMQQTLNAKLEKPLGRTSLDILVKNYFDTDISSEKKSEDSWRLRYSELEGVPLDQWPKEAKDYSIMDSVWTYKLYQELKQNKISCSRAMEASFYLNMIGKTGIKINQDRVNQLESEIYNLLEPKYKYLIDKGFCSDIGTRRPKKNMKIFREYINKHIKTPIISPKGTIKTDLESLSYYYTESEDEVFKYFQELNDYDKVLTAFVSRLKGNSYIYTDYSTTKSTGRTSSFTSKLYPSVNIQQMPRRVPNVTYDVRNCFVPREGYKMVSIDYSGLELASAATQLQKTFNRSAMLDMLNSGTQPVDLHSMLAAKIMSLKGENVSYSHFVDNKKLSKYANMRQLCKAINLGFPGGIGYDNMRKILFKGGTKTKYGVLTTSRYRNTLMPNYYSLKFEEPNIRIKQTAKDEYALVYDELVGLKKNMFQIYPELESFLTKSHKHSMTGATKWMKDDFGEWEEEPMYKYKVSDFERDWCTYTAYCNGYLMQTPSAIGATNTAIQLGRKYLNHPNVNLLAFIHDEFLFEIKDIGDNVLNITRDIAQIMINEMQKVLKGVRIAVEYNIMDYWSKESDNSGVYFKDANSDYLKVL